MDQNIDLPDGGCHLLGTQLAAQLRSHGFRGVTCILTASSARDIDHSGQSAGVDLALDKATSLKEQQRLIESAISAKRLEGL